MPNNIRRHLRKCFEGAQLQLRHLLPHLFFEPASAGGTTAEHYLHAIP
jgi:hypothetical protein